MRRGVAAWLAAGILFSVAVPAGAVAGDQDGAHVQGEVVHDGVGAPLAVSEVVLSPGVRLVMNPDPTSKTLASCLIVPAGTRAEQPGETGLAELSLAHVLEQTSRETEPDSATLLVSRGAVMANAVGRNIASYCVTLPPRELPLALWLAALRLRTPLPTSDSFARLGPALRESALRALAESPSLAGGNKLEQLTFEGYRGADMPPVSAASLLEDRASRNFSAFFARTYHDSEAVVSLVGRFEPEQAQRLAHQHLTGIGARARIAHGYGEGTARHTSERYSMIVHPEASHVELYLGWEGPESGTREHDALALANAVLSLGGGSRLAERLVRRNRWASEVDGWVRDARGPELFGIRIRVSKRMDLELVLKAIAAEIQGLGAKGPSPEELKRGRSLLRQRFLQTMDAPLDRARYLGSLALLFGDTARAQQRLEELEQISPSEIASVVRSRLVPSRQSLVEVYPKGYPIQQSVAQMKRYYLVRSGDTLIGIAKAHGASLAELLRVNNLKRTNPIFPGQKLVIPSGAKPPPKPTEYTVRRGDTLSGIARKHGVSVREITIANGISRKKPIITGQKLVIPPKQKQ